MILDTIGRAIEGSIVEACPDIFDSGFEEVRPYIKQHVVVEPYLGA